MTQRERTPFGDGRGAVVTYIVCASILASAVGLLLALWIWTDVRAGYLSPGLVLSAALVAFFLAGALVNLVRGRRAIRNTKPGLLDSSSRPWRRYRVEYGIVVGSAVLILIASATLTSNFRVCSGWRLALSASAGEFVLIIAIFFYVVFPLLGVCVAVGGLLGFAFKIGVSRMFMVFAILAVLAGGYLGLAPHQICGGGPWP